MCAASMQCRWWLHMHTHTQTRIETHTHTRPRHEKRNDAHTHTKRFFLPPKSVTHITTSVTPSVSTFIRIFCISRHVCVLQQREYTSRTSPFRSHVSVIARTTSSFPLATASRNPPHICGSATTASVSCTLSFFSLSLHLARLSLTAGTTSVTHTNTTGSSSASATNTHATIACDH